MDFAVFDATSETIIACLQIKEFFDKAVEEAGDDVVTMMVQSMHKTAVRCCAHFAIIFCFSIRYTFADYCVARTVTW